MAKKQELCQKGIFRLELCLCFLRREVMLNVTDRKEQLLQTMRKYMRIDDEVTVT